MAKPKILVTTAAGRTGFPVARQLLEKGYPVRAFVHRESARAEALRAGGAEIFAGNMFDIRDLREAMKGVQRAYYCPPLGPNMLHASAMFAVAAEEARLESVTNMTQWFANPVHPSFATREHWLIDKILPWMPNVGVVTINPSLFAEVFYLIVLAPVAQLGLFPMPMGMGKNAPASNEDMASVAVGTLIDPAPHLGKSYRPTGPALVTPQDAADIFAKILGRKVKYMDIPVPMFLKAAKLQGFAMSESAQASFYGHEHALGAAAINAPNDVVRRIGGREPEAFESIARRAIATSPDAVRTFGNKLKALSFFARLMMTRVPDLAAYRKEQNHPEIDNPVFSSKSDEWLAEHEGQDDAPHLRAVPRKAS